MLVNTIKTFYNLSMQGVWDYDPKELEKTESGRIKILESMINYGPRNKKIKLADVKKYWDKLQLFPPYKRLFEFLIWGKIKTPLDKSKTNKNTHVDRNIILPLIYSS